MNRIHPLSPSLRLLASGDYDQSFASALSWLNSILSDIHIGLATTEERWGIEDACRHFFDLMTDIFIQADCWTKEGKEERVHQIWEILNKYDLSFYGICNTHYYSNLFYNLTINTDKHGTFNQ